MSKQKKKPFENLVYDFTIITGLPAFVILRPKKHYQTEKAREKIKGGALLIANHVGFTDPVALMLCIWYRRHRFICAEVFYENKVAAWLFNQFHCIPVNRENVGMDTMRTIVDALKNDQIVTMFPEGHVSTAEDKGTDQFKSGMVLMSVMSRKPIVPIYIAPRKSIWERVHMMVGDPIDIVGKYGPMPSLAQIEEITKELRECEDNLKNLLEERRSKK